MKPNAALPCPNRWPAPYSFNPLLFAIAVLLVSAILHPLATLGQKPQAPVLRAGASVIDINPPILPVHVLGMFTDRTSDTIHDPLTARCLVLDDGRERLALMIVDSCMVPRDLLDHAKELAHERTGLPKDRILIASTHTHSAPSAMGGLGTPPDTNYVAFLPERLAEGIAHAVANLEPAQVGWTSVEDWDHTFCRRWIRRPDRLGTDPFGGQTVRAHMHPGYLNPDAMGPSGPVDPGLSVLAVRTLDGKPLAVLANYSMHYYGSPMLSADYFGYFARDLENRLRGQDTNATPVVMMSQGTSGDAMWMDYGQPQKDPGLEAYARAVADRAWDAYRSISFTDQVPLAMAEATLPLTYRQADPDRLARAQQVVRDLQGRLPRTLPEVYAYEAVYLHERPNTELKIQALRIGDLGITALPNEVYALTGLKLKARSPLPLTFNIELANGAEGYIPPPEQHQLGGYTTWAARTAGLEIPAEPRIVETALQLLERVAQRPRRQPQPPETSYAEAITALQPFAYWRLEDMDGSLAVEVMGRHSAQLHSGFAFYLDGPQSAGFSKGDFRNRSVHFVNGSMQVDFDAWSTNATVSFWFWNGLATDARPVTGHLFSLASLDRSAAGEKLASEWRLGLAGQGEHAGQLFFTLDDNQPATVFGRSILPLRSWHQLALVQTTDRVRIFLDGAVEPELELPLPTGQANGPTRLRWANRMNGDSGWEGKLDEIAVFDRALEPHQVKALYEVSGMEPIRRAEIHRQREQLLGPPLSANYAKTVTISQPLAYWRCDEGHGRTLVDVNHGRPAGCEPGARTLDREAFPEAPPDGLNQNLAVACGGGRVRAEFSAAELGSTYSVEFWFLNDLPDNARAVTAYLFSRGADQAPDAPGDHLGIGGTHEGGRHQGRLIFFNGNRLNTVLSGPSVLEPRTWNHVVWVRRGARIQVYLNGREQPEISGDVAVGHPANVGILFFGGRNDQFANLQGRLDEIAVYDRALPAHEIQSHFQAAGMPARPVPLPPPTAEPESPPLSPADSLQTVRLKEGFVMELVAAEPLVVDPVAIDWDAHGRLWVAEMADYPNGIDGHMKAGGRIRVLEDTDRDGRYDQSTVFLDGVNFPNGLVTWGRGVIVTAAPEIFYAEDSDGDGKADRRETLYRGFVEGNPQLRINGLRYGLDGWLYCANGWSGGQVTSLRSGDTADLRGRDLRLQPDTGRLELLSGVSQFGRERNDWGDWFGVNNSNPLWHYVLEDVYTRRNPDVPMPSPIVQLLRPPNPKIFPAKTPEKRFHSFDQAGRFTSACASMIYRDDLLFGDGREDHAFICEPFHNLVHHSVVRPDGVTFRAERAEDEKDREFLASSDRWFRPVMTRTGPDGALWVVDMYRYMIEHPEWLPANGKAELAPNYRAGDDRGRIYRVYHASRPPRPWAGLAGKDGNELVEMLESPNGWIRDQVQQRLVNSIGDNSEILAHLTDKATNGRRPQARLHALAILPLIGHLPDKTLRAALQDPHPAVRRQAVRWAEPSARPDLLEGVTPLASDPDPKVQLQVAASLGAWTQPAAGDALARMALRSPEDDYIQAMILSSAGPHFTRLAAAAVREPKTMIPLMEGLLRMGVARQDGAWTDRLLLVWLPDSLEPGEAWDRLQTFYELLNRRGTDLEGLWGHEPAGKTNGSKRCNHWLRLARQTAEDQDQPLSRRLQAVPLLGLEPSRRGDDLELLARLIDARQSPELQLAAARTLGRQEDSRLPALFFRDWASRSPQMIAVLLDQLMGREDWCLDLLKQIADGAIPATQLDAARRQRLREHRSEAVRARAETAFAHAWNRDREAVVESFQSVLSTQGKPSNGAAIFEQRCAICHKIRDQGAEVGPDLRSVAGHPAEKLLISILDPSREVATQYLAYTCALRSGEELYGVIAGESGTSLTLRLADNNQRAILRGEIQSLQAGGKSLMPDGLEEGLNAQALADLIAYLQSGGMASNKP